MFYRIDENDNILFDKIFNHINNVNNEDLLDLKEFGVNDKYNILINNIINNLKYYKTILSKYNILIPFIKYLYIIF